MSNSPDLSLVVPCLNEEGNVEELGQRFFAEAARFSVPCEIVFVDDGSTDQTVARISKISPGTDQSVTVVSHGKNLGIPTAWRSGVGASRGQYVCLIDGDLQNRPEDAINLYQILIQRGVDVVRGVRISSGGVPKSRIVTSKLLNLMLNTIFRMSSKDNKSGFLVASRETMYHLTHPTGRYNHYQTFIGVAAKARRLTQVEVATIFEDRRSGVSFLTGGSRRVIIAVLRDFPQAYREFIIKPRGTN